MALEKVEHAIRGVRFCKLIVYLTIVTLCIYYEIHINQSGLYNLLLPLNGICVTTTTIKLSPSTTNLYTNAVLCCSFCYYGSLFIAYSSEGKENWYRRGCDISFDNDAKVFSVSNIGGQLVPSV